MLRDFRMRRGLSVRQVATLSASLSEERGDSRYRLSHSWICRLERRSIVPTTFAATALAVIYEVSRDELLDLYSPAPSARPAVAPSAQAFLPGGRSPLSGSIRSSFDLSHNCIVSKLESLFDAVPRELAGNWRVEFPAPYAFIGDQVALPPTLSRGSVVCLEPLSRPSLSNPKVEVAVDQPIFLVMLRDGLFCSWCEFRSDAITLLPNPASGLRAKTVSRSEVDLIGRLTKLAFRIRTHSRFHRPSLPVSR